MSFSNLIGPIEEISFFGHPIAYMAPSVYGHPHVRFWIILFYVMILPFIVFLELVISKI